MSKQFAIKEVVNCWLRKYSDDSPICYVDYASDTTFSYEAERLDLRGGQGNYILVSFDHTKSGMMMLEMPLVDLEFLSQLTGQDLDIGASTAPYRETLTIASSQATLASTPTSGSVKVYKLENSRDYGTEQTEGSASNPNEYEISGGVITVNSSSIADGEKIIVEYTYSTPATTRTITFTANNFPPYMTIDGIGTWLDEYEGAEKTVIFEVFKCKPRNNFTITQKSTEATILTMEFDLFTIDDSSGNKVYMKTHQLTG